MSRIITFGEIMLRLSPNGYYRFCQNDLLQATYGGGEANVAVSLANFGVDVGFVTKLPNNPIAKGAIDMLKYFSVDTSKVVFGGERIGIYFLEKGAGERPSVCVYDRKHSSIQESSATDFDWDNIFERTEWFHFTGITPALGPNLVEICRQACVAAKEKGITISCDLNYRSKLWNREMARDVMTDLCQYVDVCIANEEDAKDVFGMEASHTDIERGQLDSAGYMRVAEQLKQMFNFKCVAITLRSSISASDNDWAGLLYDGKEHYFSRTHHIRIIDRVGGGDSFGAGLIYSLINGYDSRTAIEFAVAASALKQTIEGDFNRVSVAEVNKLMHGTVTGRISR